MANIPPLSENIVFQISKSFDKSSFLTHKKIDDLLANLGIEQIPSSSNRTDKLADALIANQNKYKSGNKVLDVIDKAISDIKTHELFDAHIQENKNDTRSKDFAELFEQIFRF